ncbi:hypothetical protein QBC46DRAFT_314888 [Diplogelasinospora grovesii]|uniref:DUF1772-domain-containing protein n=1 Tax=Diplogelasinospora grovesii TaxID=303347 RepID=A0AAN6N768_9PEZI|nr:hypothetical protein QBC46DRAFT_314888 [Diplogelasinospora grovesii]
MASSTLAALAQWTAIFAPTLYAGMTAQYSLTILTYTRPDVPPKLVAKQWLQLYQQGPYWVRPVVAAGTLSNLYLAWFSSPNTTQQRAYIVAAALIGSILPLTFLYFEPGINGACKWKAQSLLQEEGFSMPPFNGTPSSVRHSATAATKRWAEQTDIKDLVATWGTRNHVRWVIGVLAAAVSGYAGIL